MCEVTALTNGSASITSAEEPGSPHRVLLFLPRRASHALARVRTSGSVCRSVGPD